MTDKGYHDPVRSNGQVHEGGPVNGRDSGTSVMIVDSTPVSAEELTTDGAPEEAGHAVPDASVDEDGDVGPDETAVKGADGAEEKDALSDAEDSSLKAREAQESADRLEADEPDMAIEPETGGPERGTLEAPEEETAEAATPLFSDEDRWRHLRMGEALLFASAEPLSKKQIADRLPDGADVDRVLADLTDTYADRGVNLIRVAGGWAFRTATDLSFLMERERVEQKKLSRAALETLAIIAYHQPVTRAEIEDVRGVSVSKGTLDVLMEVGWVRVRGRRQTPGRPVTYGTSDAFLEHFGLDRVSDLPGLDELKAAGLLDTRMPTNLSVPTPSDIDAPSEEDDDTAGVLEEEDHEAYTQPGEDTEQSDFNLTGNGLEADLSTIDESGDCESDRTGDSEDHEAETAASRDDPPDSPSEEVRQSSSEEVGEDDPRQSGNGHEPDFVTDEAQEDGPEPGPRSTETAEPADMRESGR